MINWQIIQIGYQTEF